MKLKLFTKTVEDTVFLMINCNSFFLSPNLDTPITFSQLQTNFRCSFHNAPRANIIPKFKTNYENDNDKNI